MAATKTKRRENVVITVGRIAPGKNLDIIPYIVAKTRSVKKFLIVGNIQTMLPDYLNRLQHLINKLGVRDKVVLLPNLTFEKKIELMANSRIYLHTMPN
ncbi:MAG: glycosyltransferase [Aigarchaeota archaeon]|nr:glycosyltransferase [Candidatus Pelearchaeum maunauluense]